MRILIPSPSLELRDLVWYVSSRYVREVNYHKVTQMESHPGAPATIELKNGTMVRGVVLKDD